MPVQYSSQAKDAEEAALGKQASGTSVYLIRWKPTLSAQNGRDRKAESQNNDNSPSVSCGPGPDVGRLLTEDHDLTAQVVSRDTAETMQARETRQ